MNRDFYDPSNSIVLDENGYPTEPVFSEEHDGTFHVMGVHEETSAATVFCKKCNGKEFNVGTGQYFTAIKCVTCGWEQSIHEG